MAADGRLVRTGTDQSPVWVISGGAQRVTDRCLSVQGDRQFVVVGIDLHIFDSTLELKLTGRHGAGALGEAGAIRIETTTHILCIRGVRLGVRYRRWQAEMQCSQHHRQAATVLGPTPV